jgi:hypothetical protein
MLPQAHTAVVDRNEPWSGKAASEPYEAGWAREAIIWWRILDISGPPEPVEAYIQISPDGLRWMDEGSVIRLDCRVDELGFARISHFGNFLRLATHLPDGLTLKTIVTMTLKA